MKNRIIRINKMDRITHFDCRTSSLETLPLCLTPGIDADEIL
jgi:hypothetical protein